jgi:hypothetical protein
MTSGLYSFQNTFMFGFGHVDDIVGGFVGMVVNTALMYSPLQSGYATAGTDTGHQANSLDGSWALNNLERVVSFGHQAVHRTAVTSQALPQMPPESIIPPCGQVA